MEGLNRTLETSVDETKKHCLVKVVIAAVPMKWVMGMVMLTLVAKPLKAENTDTLPQVNNRMAQKSGPAKEDHAGYIPQDTTSTLDLPARRRERAMKSTAGLVVQWVAIGLIAGTVFIVNWFLLFLELICYKRLRLSPDPKELQHRDEKRMMLAETRVTIGSTLGSMIGLLIVVAILFNEPLNDFKNAKTLILLVSGTAMLSVPLAMSYRAGARMKAHWKESVRENMVDTVLVITREIENPAERDKALNKALDKIIDKTEQGAQEYGSFSRMLRKKGKGRQTADN